MFKLSIGDCIRFGWETFKRRPGILIGALLLILILPAIPHAIVPVPIPEPGVPPPPPTAAQGVAGLVSGIISLFLSMGGTTFFLRAHDGVDSVKIGDLWNPQPFWRFLGAHILVFIAVAIGLVLLVIPGIIVALGLSFVAFTVIDLRDGPVEALKDSWRITNGHKWQLFLLGLALIGLNILGFLAMVLGMLVTMPISWLALTHAYRTLAARAGA